MGKHTPHCRLTVVKAPIKAGRVTATGSAAAGARAVGINTLNGMCEVVLSLSRADFYKSMTTHADHTIWQDVYRCATHGGIRLYVKLTVVEDVLIVSFKEL